MHSHVFYYSFMCVCTYVSIYIFLFYRSFIIKETSKLIELSYIVVNLKIIIIIEIE